MPLPIPDLFPDELLVSMFARLNDRLRARVATLGELLFGTSGSCLYWTLPNGLARLEQLLGPSFRPTVDELLEDHTLYRFYRVLLPSTTGTLWHEMQKSGSVSLHDSLRYYMNVTGVPVQLRYCPLCAEEDTRHFGEPYWHRAHQIPGVFVCPSHAVFLNHSDVSSYEVPSRACLHKSAHAVLRPHRPRPLNISLTSHVRLLSIADTLTKMTKKQTASQVISTMRPSDLRILPSEAWNLLRPPEPPKRPQRLIPPEGQTVSMREIPAAFAGQEWTKNLIQF